MSGRSAGASWGSSAARRAISRRDSAPIAVPPSVTRPAAGACSPSSRRISVDFPAPFGPHSATSSPGRIDEADVAEDGAPAVAEAEGLGGEQRFAERLADALMGP